MRVIFDLASLRGLSYFRDRYRGLMGLREVITPTQPDMLCPEYLRSVLLLSITAGANLSSGSNDSEQDAGPQVLQARH